MPLGAVQTATPVDFVAEGQYSQLQIKDGRLWVAAIVSALPALPPGANNIGDVDVLTVPADPFGVNADAAVAAGAAGSIQAKLRRLTTDLDALNAKLAAAAALATGTAFPTTTIDRAASMLSNLTTLDPETGNTLGTVLSSAARTTTTAANIVNYNCTGMLIWVNVTAAPGGGEFIVPAIQVIDPVSGQNPNYWQAAANITTTGSFLYLFYPGVSAAGANVTETKGYPIPRMANWRMNHSASGSWTYSVGVGLIK